MLLPATDANGDYSAAVSYNVLEHIEDHVGALRSMARRWSAPAARIMLIVPAFMFAMSQVDIATGHIRRYTKKTMRAALTEAGLEIEKLHYANALGLIGYYGATSIFKLAPKEGPMVKVYDTRGAAGHQGRREAGEAAVRPVRLRRGPRPGLTRPGPTPPPGLAADVRRPAAIQRLRRMPSGGDAHRATGRGARGSGAAADLDRYATGSRPGPGCGRPG